MHTLASENTAVSDRTWWMTGRYGIIVHWLYPTTNSESNSDLADFDSTVASFNLERFLSDFLETGASWLMFTIAQNTGYYVGPNPTLDAILGPGHTSRRDLLHELAAALHQHGKKFVLYLPSEVQYQSQEIRDAFGWNSSDQSEFQRRYTSVIKDYSIRYGDLVDGWWFDGCYEWDQFDNKTYDWPLWTGAARAGNPEACLAFNDGSFYLNRTMPVTSYQDYLSGEIGILTDGKIRLGRGTEEDGVPELYVPSSRFVGEGQCQWHGMLPIDCAWMHDRPGLIDPPRYSDAELGTFVSECLGVGGAITLNVGIYREGHLARATVEQLKRLKSSWT